MIKIIVVVAEVVVRRAMNIKKYLKNLNIFIRTGDKKWKQ